MVRRGRQTGEVGRHVRYVAHRILPRHVSSCSRRSRAVHATCTQPKESLSVLLVAALHSAASTVSRRGEGLELSGRQLTARRCGIDSRWSSCRNKTHACARARHVRWWRSLLHHIVRHNEGWHRVRSPVDLLSAFTANRLITGRNGHLHLHSLRTATK